ncbi:E3 ubiquitin ligase TRAF3IP2-like [Clavelina lepadiformis]|uniref:E3 ubiquitin ligase TRAF3IP2-like n=1 Tax=Clavelina lepadiformis TaxID=159417 RepID=UPI004042A501
MKSLKKLFQSKRKAQCGNSVDDPFQYSVENKLERVPEIAESVVPSEEGSFCLSANLSLSSNGSCTNGANLPQSIISVGNGLEHTSTGIFVQSHQHQPQTQQRTTEISNRISTNSTDSDYSFQTQHPSFEVNDQGPSSSQPKPDVRKQLSAPSQNQNLPDTTAMKNVFITHAFGRDEINLKTVLEIAQKLRANSIDVICDMFEQEEKTESVATWLDKHEKSNFVMIIMNPKYKQIVCENGTQQFDPEREEELQTKYIYRRIHDEYIKSGSLNKRFIPVLIENAESSHVPGWLQDTKKFKWPNDFEDIVFRIFGKEKYQKPKLGPCPTFTRVSYDS